jgi:hypothetical protein
MSVILKYKEYLKILPNETYWVYDLCHEMPHWDDKEEDYVCSKKSKRIDARKAKEIIRKEGLMCVCDNEYGRIYA